jgi:hypothetical protein
VTSHKLRWRPIRTVPNGYGSSDVLLVTNNIRARDSRGNKTHVWLVSAVYKDGSEYSAFTENMQRLYGLTHWMRLNL